MEGCFDSLDILLSLDFSYEYIILYDVSIVCDGEWFDCFMDVDIVVLY